GNSSSCTRRSRRVRIATVVPARSRQRSSWLHPTFASGEDRNDAHAEFLRGNSSSCTRRSRRVRIATPGDGTLTTPQRRRLHPTFASGEDRNGCAPLGWHVSAGPLHPTFASGEDRNSVRCLARYTSNACCTRRSRRVRIATTWSPPRAPA